LIPKLKALDAGQGHKMEVLFDRSKQ
jgi:hypothetical protein